MARSERDLAGRVGGCAALATAAFFMAWATGAQAFAGPLAPAARHRQLHKGWREAPLSVPGGVGVSVVLSPRQREERELEEQDVLRANTQIAKGFAEKVLQRAPEGSAEKIKAKLDKLVDKAGLAVSEQELRPLLDRMARLVDSKAWYIVEKGDIEVVPLVLEAEQKEIESMQALMDAGNHSAALTVYQSRYKRFQRNPPPPEQTALAFEALYKTERVNQTVVLYNHWYNAKGQGNNVMNSDCLYWVIRSLCSVGRLDMALDVFRSHPRFDILPNRDTMDLLLRESINRELYELGSELLESTELGGFGIDAELVYELTEKLLDMQLLDHADRAIKVLLKRRLPIDPKLGTYFKNFVVKNGRMHLAYTHLTDPRLTHPNFRASANGYNMLLWRMCRLFMRMRESALSDGSSGAAAAVGGGPAPSVSTKQELRGLALRIARVVSTMNRYGYRVTPQSGAMLQDVAAATGDFGMFRVLELKLKEMEEEEPDFGL